MLGQKLTDEEMRNIKYPETELYTHVTFKTIQAGALLGMVIIAPVVRLAAGPRTLGAVLKRQLFGMEEMERSLGFLWDL